MNQKPLDDMIREAVDHFRGQNDGPLDVDEATEAVLASPDMALFMKGIENHDRSGDLDDIYTRDIRRMVAAYIEELGEGRLPS